MSKFSFMRTLLFVISVFAVQFALAQSETPATIPASMTGTYSLTYTRTNTGGPFTNGQAVSLVVKSDNSLCVNGTTYTNPVIRNGNAHEAIWKATSISTEFALSSLVNGFNEVNVGSLGGSAFYGQLKGSKTSTSTTCTAQPQVTASMNSLFQLAESKLAAYFPPGAVTLFLENYVYRFYPSTGVYLAFAGNNVYLLGGAFGNAVVDAGTISSVLAALETYQAPGTGGGGSGTADLWKLTISGSFNTTFIQNLAFSGITLQNVPAPDLNNTSAINQEINSTLSGVASNIGSITITVVNNTSTRRTFDVRFTATVTGAGTVTYNLRYDYTK